MPRSIIDPIPKSSNEFAEMLAQSSAASAGYARPGTRGELAKLLKKGIPCEVASTNVDISVTLLTGWLGIEKITVRPSENEGWSVFEA